jgi:hypothetical protein
MKEFKLNMIIDLQNYYYFIKKVIFIINYRNNLN